MAQLGKLADQRVTAKCKELGNAQVWRGCNTKLRVCLPFEPAFSTRSFLHGE
jgi:hypothetical protein